MIGFDDTSDIWANGARNHLWIGDAETVSEVKFFGVEIRAQGVGAEMLGAMTKAAIGEEQESVGKLHQASKIIDPFAAEAEVGAGDTRLERSALGIMPTAPDFSVDIGCLSECEKIEAALLLRFEKGADNCGIEGA